MKQTRGEKVFTLFNLLFLGVLSFVALYPFIYTLSLSLSTAAEAARDGFHLYPREVSVTAYRMILNNREILVGYGNTVLRTVVGTALTLIFTCLCAYPLSRKDMPLRRVFMLMIILTMLFDGGLIPNYLLRKNLGLLNNRLVYILPYILAAFNIIVVKNFFQQVPEALAEAARIDGASEFRTLWQIYVPLSKPVLATVALWTAVMHWNMWFDAMVFVTDNNKQVMQTFLQRIVIDSSTEMAERGLINPDVTQFTPETVKAATIIVTILPMLALYPFVQRYFVKGIQLGGVKE